MSLQARISTRIKQLREAKGLTQEQLAGMARSDAATLSRIESGKRNITAETLAFFLIALNVTPKDFFGTPEFAQTLTTNPDDPESVNSESFAVEEIGGGVRVHFPCGRHEASLEFTGLDRQTVTNAVLILRRGLRQAELTPRVTGAREEAGDETRTLMSAAIAESFLSVVQGNPNLNPSDVWRYIIYRAFCDPQNHPESSFRKNLTESFKRTSGWAFERILAAYYTPFLSKHDVILTNANPDQLLAGMGLAGQIPLEKLDMFIAVPHGEAMIPLGVIHFKSSIAERRKVDEAPSKLVMNKEFLSLCITVDGKDTPSPTPVNQGEYGQPLVYDEKKGIWKGREKRKEIEEKGLFSAVFSFNSRTIESPPTTESGCRIMTVNFSNPDDKLSRFILDAKDEILRRTQGKGIARRRKR